VAWHWVPHHNVTCPSSGGIEEAADRGVLSALPRLAAEASGEAKCSACTPSIAIALLYTIGTGARRVTGTPP
jgi:hypothetical protein